MRFNKNVTLVVSWDKRFLNSFKKCYLARQRLALLNSFKNCWSQETTRYRLSFSFLLHTCNFSRHCIHVYAHKSITYSLYSSIIQCIREASALYFFFYHAGNTVPSLEFTRIIKFRLISLNSGYSKYILLNLNLIHWQVDLRILRNLIKKQNVSSGVLSCNKTWVVAEMRRNYITKPTFEWFIIGNIHLVQKDHFRKLYAESLSETNGALVVVVLNSRRIHIVNSLICL